MKKKNGLFYLIFLCAFISMLSCSGTSTEEYLDGDFIDSLGEDTTAPNILSPRSGEKVLIINPVNGDPVNVALQWTSKNNASYYTVEVADDSGFVSQIDGSPFTVEDVFLELSLDDARRYYWRVRADITAAGQYGSSYFDTMDDTVYVYCPESEGACNDSGKVGNKDEPFRTITAGLVEANRLGLKKVKVAARADASDTAYEETIPILNGIDLTGGYAPLDPADKESDFSEALRDPDLNRTVITGESIYAVFANNIFQTTVMEGFEINGPDEDVGTFALYIVNSSRNLTVRNCKITGGPSATFYSAGASLVDSFSVLERNIITGGIARMSAGMICMGYGSPKIINNEISGADLGQTSACTDCESTGLMLDWGFPEIQYNIIKGGEVIGDEGTSSALTVDNDASPKLLNNIIIAGEVIGDNGTSLGVVFREKTNGTVTNNIIVGGNVVGTLDNESYGSYGIYMQPDCQPSFTNNTIRAGNGEYSYGIFATGSSENRTSPFVNFNILFTDDGAGFEYGFYEENTNADPDEFTNNLIFNITSNYYYHDADGFGNLTTIPAVNNYNNTTQSIVKPSEDNITAANTGVVFLSYDPNIPKTWSTAGGIADVDPSGTWTEEDIGANADEAGPRP